MKANPALENLLVHQQFAIQAEIHPQKVSITFHDQSLSYAELLYYSQQLAHHLINVWHVQRHQIVTQCINRSIEMIIGIMAILMTGATYCPLSFDQPAERLRVFITQTQSVCTLIHSMIKPFVRSTFVEIDQVLWSHNSRQIWTDDVADVDDIAYIIFTSGSTGTPKGVPISHHNLVTYIHGLESSNILTNNDVVLQICSVTFDVHVEEILGTLLLGGQVVLLRHHGNLDIEYMISSVKNFQITYIAGVPTMFRELAENLACKEGLDACLPTIRSLVIGGKRDTKLVTFFYVISQL